jgi:hypothetical protein
MMKRSPKKNSSKKTTTSSSKKTTTSRSKKTTTPRSKKTTTPRSKKTTTRNVNPPNKLSLLTRLEDGYVLSGILQIDNKLRQNQLTIDLNKLSKVKINQIRISYEPNRDRIRDVNYELLKLGRLRSVFKILEKIGKRFDKIHVQTKKGRKYNPEHNTCYKFSIDKILRDSDLDYVEGVIYSKRDNVVIPHSWNYNRKTKKHIDYSIKRDKGDFTYYGVIIDRDSILKFCYELDGNDIEVSESILELCSLNSKRRDIIEEIDDLRRRFIPQKTYKG